MNCSARPAVAALAFAATVAFSTGDAQSVARGQTAQQPSFRTTTTVVEVDVIVRDRQRRFVDDLTAADFEVLEDGKPQIIRALYVVRGSRVEPRPPLDAAATAPAVPDDRGATRAPTVQRVFVWFFDQEHLTQSSFIRVQAAAETHLKTEFHDGDIGGVLMGGTMVGNRLTRNKDELVAAVRSVKLNASATSRKRDLQDWPRMSEVEAIRIAIAFDSRVLDQVVERARREGAAGRREPDLRPAVMEKARVVVTELQRAAALTLRTLQTVVTGLAKFPGRKTVVFLSEGFLFEQSWGELRQIVGQAARSNVRIYSIDALGLQRRSSSTDLSVLAPLETGGQIPMAAYDTIEEGPNTLAVDTGGYVVRGTNDFVGALAEVARDTSDYYVLGYSPSNTVFDGKFRPITVRVKRNDAEVRARKGYLATAPAAADAPPPAPATTAAQPGGAAVGAPPPVAAPGAPLPAGAPTREPGREPAREPPPPTAAAALPGEPSGPPPGLAAPTLRPDAAGRVRTLAETDRSGKSAAMAAASAGWERYSKGDLEGAEKLLARAAADPSAPPWVHYALGFAQVALGKTPDAVQSWEHVRVAAPEFQAVYLDLADAYVQTEDPGKAIEVLRQAEARWPADADVLNALGTIQVRRGTLNDAIATFENAVEKQPADALAYFNLGRTYELRYYQMRRFSRPDNRWVASPEDLRRARRYYEAYVRMGGPYEAEARGALERIGWRQPAPAT